MTDIIKACFDRLIPESRLVEAAIRARAENPDNAPSPSAATGALGPFGAAVLTKKRWKPGRVLRFHFMNGSLASQNQMQEEAVEWTNHISIRFEFVNDPEAEIRVSFEEPGAWSYLGTDNLMIPKHLPTMNFGFLDTGTVLHEVGHCLGMIHEHQSPAVEIPWDKEAVYRDLGGPPNYWPPDVVDHNLFETYEKEITNFSEYDRESIMHYFIPNRWTKGDFEVPQNTTLSEKDKSFMGQIYP